MSDAEMARGAGAPGRPDEHGTAAEAGPLSRPGSDGEHALQQRLGTAERADRFYDQQVLDHLNERMQEFVRSQEMFFLATADRRGECDNTFRAGPPGFLRVLDERTLLFPEYRGNGVHASLGNLQENPHVGILLMDFLRARIGLHLNGRAEVLEDAAVRTEHPDLPVDPVPGRRARMWVKVWVDEAYIHCAKHIPHLQKVPKGAGREWGTDDHKRKGGDFFGVAREARERGPVEWEPREHEPAPLPGQRPVAQPGDLPPQPALPPVTEPVAKPHTEPASEPAAEPGVTPVAEPVAEPGREPALEPVARTEPLPDDTPTRNFEPVRAYGGPRHARSYPEHQTPVAQWRAVPGASGQQVPPLPGVPSQSSAREDAAGRAPQPQAGEVYASAYGTASYGAGYDAGYSAGAYATGPVPPGTGAAAGASAVIAARGAVPTGEDAEAWRLEAERALEDAQQRVADEESSSFQGWFG